MAKETIMTYHLPIAGVEKWIDAFPKGISKIERQTALSRIWTWVANSISYDDNHYTNQASFQKFYVWSDTINKFF